MKHIFFICNDSENFLKFSPIADTSRQRFVEFSSCEIFTCELARAKFSRMNLVRTKKVRACKKFGREMFVYEKSSREKISYIDNRCLKFLIPSGIIFKLNSLLVVSILQMEELDSTKDKRSCFQLSIYGLFTWDFTQLSVSSIISINFQLFKFDFFYI